MIGDMRVYNFIFTPVLVGVYVVGMYYIVDLLYRIKVGEVIFEKRVK